MGDMADMVNDDTLDRATDRVWRSRELTMFDSLGGNDRYRYLLRVSWGEAHAPALAWVMLNPSTATAQRLDPTMRRVIDFTAREGYTALDVVNLYALRSTDPAALWTSRDPVGPENDETIRMVAAQADRIVLAWGAHGRRARAERVLSLLPVGKPWLCLGRTRGSQPRHPLQVRRDREMEEVRW